MKALALLLVVLVAWALGLAAFARRVARSTPAPAPPVADAVVALTGGSNVRLEAAERLLEDGRAQRLLISGVNRLATRADVEGAVRGSDRTWACCVDLGFRAADTRGNAEETSRWARYHDYRSVIVVTADYHMPRALLELRSQTPEVSFIPYPVVTDLDARSWWRSGAGAKRMTVEYCKYLVILARTAITGLGRHAPQPANAATPNATGRPA